jgi:5-formyltetrahydrofolate cyclo-ligase
MTNSTNINAPLTTKAELRKRLLSARSALDPARRAEADRVITEQLLQTPEYLQAQTIFTYVSVGDEIDTSEIIRAGLAAGKQITVPRCASFGQMDAVAITGTNDLITGMYDLLEPREGLPVVAPELINMIIVPCLAATLDGMRLGYGGGFYDRYLARCCNATSIVLCRSEFLLVSLPHESHDVPVHKVIQG